MDLQGEERCYLIQQGVREEEEWTCLYGEERCDLTQNLGGRGGRRVDLFVG